MPPPKKRKIAVVDLTGDGQGRKTPRTSGSQRLGSSQEVIDLSQDVPSTQAELEDERNATELVDSSQGLDDNAYASYVLYGNYRLKFVCALPVHSIIAFIHQAYSTQKLSE